jgi:hypothetical protein
VQSKHGRSPAAHRENLLDGRVAARAARGMVKRITYQNSENGYLVARPAPVVYPYPEARGATGGAITLIKIQGHVILKVVPPVPAPF